VPTCPRSTKWLALYAGVVIALAVPASASAHAYLVRTVPSASGVVNTPPAQVSLTFDEAVEPRFAIISVTDKDGHQVTDGRPERSPADPNTLVVPLKKVPEGWYLVYWRVISVDGHPVRGAFTFAVGPNQGPQPEFVIPSIAESAATPRLVAARAAVFLTVMSAIGLFVLRLGIARPVIRRVDGTNLRAVSIAFFAAAALGLIAIPVYLDVATAEFSLRSAFDLGAVVPLLHASAFGRGYIDLWICFALFVAAAAVALWVDRPERPQRSIAELLAAAGAGAAALAVLLVPGAAGHAAQTAPRGVSLLLDWLHLTAGSVWVGGLLGLLVLWRSLPVARRVAGLVVTVPRFSNTALVSVLLLLGTGIGATVIHMPTLPALWQTSYGKTILVKIALLACALLLAAVNLARTKPRLAASRQRVELGPPAAGLLRRLVGGELLLVWAAVVAAAVLSSLAPPPPALAQEGGALARVGPGPVSTTVTKDGYKLQVLVSPNKAAVPNDFVLKLTRNGKPVTGADVTVTFAMLDMEMGNQEFRLTETSPGVYSRPANPALVMVGHWGLSFQVTPKDGPPFTALVVDRTAG
jgi:copper transport protein